MSDFEERLPPATPDTQTEPRARAGGTGGMADFSRSAQRSRSHQPATEAETTLEPLETPQKPLRA